MALSVGVAQPGTTLTTSYAKPQTLTMASPTNTGSLSVGTSSSGNGTSTLSPQLATGSSQTNTYNPQQTSSIPAYYGGGGTTYSNTADFTPDATAGGTSTYDAAAAAAAARTAQANALKSSITGLIGNIKGVYDAIYSDVNNVAADRTAQVDKSYNQDVQGLTGQFNNLFPQIGQGYAARGTYDSSYRGDAEKGATDQFGNEIGQLQTGHNQDLAGIGQFVSQQQANINSQKGGLDAVSQQIAASENPDELQALKNTLDERLRTVTASRADLGTQGSYLAQLNAAVPVQNRLGPLQETLTNVINSAVPAPVKKAIANQIVSQSGVGGDEAKKLLDQINSQIDTSAGVAA